MKEEKTAIPQQFNPEKVLQGLSQKSSTSNEPHDLIIKKLDEVLFYVNMIKNSSTVKTGEFEALTQLFTGQYIYVDTRDNAAAPHLMMKGAWEDDITKALRAVFKKGDVVLDVGANFGYFSLIAGNDVGDTGKVVCLEPNPYLTPYIEKSAAINGLAKNLAIENLAISDKAGKATYNLLENDWMGSGLTDVDTLSKKAGVKYTLQEKLTVNTDTIDAVCQRLKIDSVDVIKLDVEGLEQQAFNGMKNIIKQSPKLKVFVGFTAEKHEESKNFFKEISQSFEFLYTVTKDGDFYRVETFEDVQKQLTDNWVMLVAAKEPAR